MRINVSRGRDPGGLCRYLLQKEKREPGREVELGIFATNMVGRDAEELAEEFRFAADLNTRVERIVTHYSISFPPGENPGLETKKAIVKDLLEKQGHGRFCQYFAVEHFERQSKNQVHHFHVAASSIRLDGTWVSDSFDRLQLKRTEREIELKHQLIHCPPKEKGLRRNLSTGEARLEDRTKQPCLKRKLWAAIDTATADRPSMPTLIDRLQQQGISVKFHEFEDGKGISFGAEGRYFQGRQLGDRYSFSGLQKYAGVDYQPERDDPYLRQLITNSSLDHGQTTNNRELGRSTARSTATANRRDRGTARGSSRYEQLNSDALRGFEELWQQRQLGEISEAVASGVAELKNSYQHQQQVTRSLAAKTRHLRAPQQLERQRSRGKELER